MKKSTMWLLSVVMFVAFFALLFLQVHYMRITINARNAQFDEAVRRSLNNVVKQLEIDQTYRYLQEDMIESESRYFQYRQPQHSGLGTLIRYSPVKISSPVAGSRVKATPVAEVFPMFPKTIACTFTAVPHSSGILFSFR
jgi:hypothetical protein